MRFISVLIIVTTFIINCEAQNIKCDSMYRGNVKIESIFQLKDTSNLIAIYDINGFIILSTLDIFIEYARLWGLEDREIYDIINKEITKRVKDKIILVATILLSHGKCIVKNENSLFTEYSRVIYRKRNCEINGCFYKYSFSPNQTLTVYGYCEY